MMEKKRRKVKMKVDDDLQLEEKKKIN